MCRQCRHLQRVLMEISLMERYGEQPTLPTHLHNDEWMI